MAEKIANVIGTAFIVGGAIYAAYAGRILVIGCIVDCVIFVGIGIGPMIIDLYKERFISSEKERYNLNLKKGE